jgi:hypothetical protein
LADGLPGHNVRSPYAAGAGLTPIWSLDIQKSIRLVNPPAQSTKI